MKAFGEKKNHSQKRKKGNLKPLKEYIREKNKLIY